MQFNTKLNIGDTVWIICRQNSCIREVTIQGIEISTVRNPEYVTYVTDAHVNFTDNDEGTLWWKTRDSILSYIMTQINARAKPKENPPKPETLSQAFDRLFTADDDDEPACDVGNGHQCHCGCESRPHFPEEEEMGRFYKQAVADGTEALKQSAQTAKVILGNTKDELNALYEQVFGKDKKP